MSTTKKLSSTEENDLLSLLKVRFEKNMARHEDVNWQDVQAKLQSEPQKLWSISEMERTGGEPDVVGYDIESGQYLFIDCSAESPAGRRSICFDREALDARKENKPVGNAMEMAADMGVDILSEKQYRHLQTVGKFDLKTSSWIQTPADIRKLGGALFADYRYGTVFIYHNGVQSYYAARGFRAIIAL